MIRNANLSGDCLLFKDNSPWSDAPKIFNDNFNMQVSFGYCFNMNYYSYISLRNYCPVSTVFRRGESLISIMQRFHLSWIMNGGRFPDGRRNGATGGSENRDI